MADIATWKVGDTAPALEAILKDENGPVDLTNADTIHFVMMTLKDVNVVDGACSVTDATGGAVKYEWVEGDTDTAATYNCEFVVVWSDGTEETYPHDSFFQIRIAKEATRA